MNSNFTMRASATLGALIVLILAGIAAVGYAQYRTVSTQTTESLLAKISVAQVYALQQQLAHLEELSTILANDTNFDKYIAQALDPDPVSGKVVDTVSIHDLLEMRRDELRINAAAIVDSTHRVIAAAGEGFVNGQDLSKNQLLQQTVATRNQSAGVFEDNRHAIWTAFAPIQRAGDTNATLMTGLRLDAALMRDVHRITGSDAVIIGVDKVSPHVLASSLDGQQEADLEAAISTQPDSFSAGVKASDGHVHSLVIGGERWAVQTSTLSAHEKKYLLVSLLEPKALSQPAQAVIWPLFTGTAALLFLITAMAALLRRYFIRPLTILGSLSERAIKGDYDVVYSGIADGPVGRLGAVFNLLTGELSKYRPLHNAPRRRVTDRK